MWKKQASFNQNWNIMHLEQIQNQLIFPVMNVMKWCHILFSNDILYIFFAWNFFKFPSQWYVQVDTYITDDAVEVILVKSNIASLWRHKRHIPETWHFKLHSGKFLSNCQCVIDSLLFCWKLRHFKSFLKNIIFENNWKFQTGQAIFHFTILSSTSYPVRKYHIGIL